MLSAIVEKAKKKDWQITAKNFDQTKAKAEAGDAYYQALIGAAYRRGYILEKDYKKAFKWIKLSVDQNHPLGLYNLAAMYQNGYEVKKDKNKAKDLFDQSLPGMQELAEKGYVYAQTNIGWMYESGTSVQKDEAEAVKLYRKAAEQDYPRAQTNLGWMYANGKGIEKDETEAVKWYCKAADQGDARGQVYLGEMYKRGRGVEKDYAKAVKWYQKATEQGNAFAQNKLGGMYEYGLGVPQNDAKALRLYLLSAEQNYKDGKKNFYRLESKKGLLLTKAKAGDAYYQALLGAAYRRGYPLEKDYKKALKWLKLSADQNHPLGLYNLAIMYEHGHEVKKDKDQAKTQFDQALPGMRALAKEGNVHGQANLGIMYDYGYGVKRDKTEAVNWYRRAAEQGHPGGQRSLGWAYQKAIGVEKDEAEAVKWYRKAAEQGYAVAQNNLGVMYEHGKGVKKDKAEAVKWYRKAAEQGNSRAQTNLGMMYEWGTGIKKDTAEAVKWYRKAAEQGDSSSQTYLGILYEKGKVIEKDYAEAVKWYQKAIEQGSVSAQNKLGEMYEAGRGVPQNDAKALRLYHLSAEKNYERGKKNLDRLDSRKGLLLFVKLKHRGKQNIKENPEIEDMMGRVIEASKAGMGEISTDLFKKAVQADPMSLYMDNYWYVVFKNKMPLSLVSEMLLAVKPKKKDRPDFWFSYAHCAGLAGQPGLVMSAVNKLEALARNEPDEKHAKKLGDVSSLLKAVAFIKMGRVDDAYNLLYKNGKLDVEDSAFINYVNNWTRPLLKDKKKLAFVTGIDASKWTGNYAIPKPQPFHDIESGKLITPVTAAPKLETKPEQKPVPPAETKPAAAPPPKKEKPAPKGTVLD